MRFDRSARLPLRKEAHENDNDFLVAMVLLTGGVLAQEQSVRAVQARICLQH
jgi:hypothetical protein